MSLLIYLAKAKMFTTGARGCFCHHHQWADDFSVVTCSNSIKQVISQNFYANSLRAFERNGGNRVVFKQRKLLQVDSGAEFIPVDHEGNLQSSQEQVDEYAAQILGS